MNIQSIIEKTRSQNDSATLEEMAELAVSMRDFANNNHTSSALARALHESACRVETFIAVSRPAIERIEESFEEIVSVIDMENLKSEPEMIHAKFEAMQ